MGVANKPKVQINNNSLHSSQSPRQSHTEIREVSNHKSIPTKKISGGTIADAYKQEMHASFSIGMVKLLSELDKDDLEEYIYVDGIIPCASYEASETRKNEFWETL